MNPPFQNPLVVGYKGEIGSFILQGLLKAMPKACNIWCVDIKESEQEVRNRIKKSDVIFLCVPIDNTYDWLVKHNKLLKGKIVIEQCSVKVPLFRKIHDSCKFSGYNIMSMHIMFRPSNTNKEDYKKCILLKDQFDKSYYKLFINMLNLSEIHEVEDVFEHDMIMAQQQAVVHRVLLALNLTFENAPHTYLACELFKLAHRIKQGDPVLYSRIQENEFTQNALNRFIHNLSNIDVGKIIELSQK